MKTFKKGEFACKKHKIQSNIDSNGYEHLHICLDCMLDDNGICCGKQICCNNYYKKDESKSYAYIYTCFGANKGHKAVRTLKGETLSMVELEAYAKKMEV